MRRLRGDELGRLTPDAFRRSVKHPFFLVLDNIRSAHNVGSVFRTADALGLAGIHLCGYTAVPPHREINKTALGAVDTVSWRHWTSAMEAVPALRGKGIRVVAVEHTDAGIVLPDLRPADGPMAFLFGNEVDGIGDEVLAVCDAAVEVPQWGTKHSLNVAVCAGIVAWDMVMKLGRQK